VKGKWTYLYRAVDSAGATIDFLLTARRDAAAVKRFFRNALLAPGHPRPRVINVDGNRSYPKVVQELKQEGKLGRHCRCRTCPYLNNIVEQDHRAIKRRVNASQGFRSFHGARRTIQGYEVVHIIRKGQVRWLPKGDVLGMILYLNETLGLRAEWSHAGCLHQLDSAATLFATLPVKRRLRAMQRPRTTTTAWAVIQGIEAAYMIRKGQGLGITRRNLYGQAWLFGALLGVR
jgi:transposase-like protein